MDCTTAMPRFADMAASCGYAAKPFYSIPQVAAISSIPESSIRLEVNAGRLKSFLPVGRKKGYLIAPEWFDAWVEEGTRL